MDRWTDGQMDRWTGGQKARWIEGQMDKRQYKQMERATCRCVTDGQTDRRTYRPFLQHFHLGQFLILWSAIECLNNCTTSADRRWADYRETDRQNAGLINRLDLVKKTCSCVSFIRKTHFLNNLFFVRHGFHRNNIQSNDVQHSIYVIRSTAYSTVKWPTSEIVKGGGSWR